MSYRVRTDNFEGPFDILLYLVSRQRVDIGSISIAEIADQYLEEIGRLRNLDLDVASDFLLVASTLLELKAASLIPRDRDETDEEIAELAPGEARELLIARLLEYKKYKRKEVNFFYRQTSRAGLTSTSFLEAFFTARPAVQLRKLSFATGRFMTVAGELTVNPINYFTFVEVPLSSYTTPSQTNDLMPLMNDYQRYYLTNCQTMSDGERKVYVISFDLKSPRLKGIEARLYIDSETFQLLKYEGRGMRNAVRNNYQGRVRIVPIDYSFVVNYQFVNGYTEVQSVHFKVDFMDERKHFETTGILYNVGERFVKSNHKMKFEDNIIDVIKNQDYDPMFWNKNEIVKRTPLEEEAIGLFDRYNLFGIF